MNSYERAVIEAARAVVTTKITESTPLCPGGPGLTNALLLLADELAALDEHERDQAAAGTAEMDWTLVTAGDEIRGKSGAFFPVLGTQQIGGQVKVRIGLPGGPKVITRPHPDEPFATVRRGPDGQAVDEFVNVFSSVIRVGEK